METSSLLFWRRYLRRPLGVGALAPSSASLARAMVRVLDPKPTDTVVELGPGTGVLISSSRITSGGPNSRITIAFKTFLGAG